MAIGIIALLLWEALCPSTKNVWRNYQFSIHAKEWKAAMDAEFDALIANDTWELRLSPQGRQPIKCKWVYAYKTKGLTTRVVGRQTGQARMTARFGWGTSAPAAAACHTSGRCRPRGKGPSNFRTGWQARCCWSQLLRRCRGGGPVADVAPGTCHYQGVSPGSCTLPPLKTTSASRCSGCRWCGKPSLISANGMRQAALPAAGMVAP